MIVGKIKNLVNLYCRYWRPDPDLYSLIKTADGTEKKKRRKKKRKEKKTRKKDKKWKKERRKHRKKNLEMIVLENKKFS